jgi:hypothetical protein
MLIEFVSSQRWRFVKEVKDWNAQRGQGSNVGMLIESTENKLNRSQRTKSRFYVNALC